jgi:flagellin
MRELAVQSANASNSTTDRTSLDNEFGELAKEVKRVFESTTFNSRKMLSVDAGDLEFQVGASIDPDNRITIATKNMTAQQKIAEVVGGTVPSATPTTYDTATITDSTPVANTAGDIRDVIGLIDKAIDFVSAERSVLGASQSRFEVAISYLQISSENQSASRSRIMDADFAQETANLARSQILSQAGSAMLAQANQMPQSVLSLLKG